MKQFALNVPINSVSFGIVSTAICREIFNRGLSPCILPIAQPDLGAQKKDQDFENWLVAGINKALRHHKRKTPICKLWHTNGLLESFSEKQVAIIFHETDGITDTEKNILENQEAVLATSKFTVEIMQEAGLKNVHYLPLGFDDFNFFEKKRPDSDVISFNLNGKREVRKHTDKIVKAWVKRFGNDRKYQLNLAIFNPFFRTQDGRTLNPDEQKGAFIQQVLGGKNVWNLNFLPWMGTLAEVNSFYNNGQIDLSGLSGCEGFGLPLFIQMCLGKWPVVLDAHVHKDYANAENAVLVQPSSKIKAVDGVFFHDNAPFLQGNWFSWEDDEAIAAMEKCVQKVESGQKNEKGKELRSLFTWSNTVDSILSHL